MPNNLNAQEKNELNEWLSHFVDMYAYLTEKGISPSMLGGAPISDWETVNNIWLTPKEEYSGTIVDFPQAIAKLQTVTFIRIEGIIIPEFPEVVTKLKNLETVMMSGVGMKVVNESIGNLHKLLKCDLNDNDIQYLPEEIAGLSSLEEFGVANNQLDSLPDVFSDIHNLARFFAYGNNLTSIPESIELNIDKLIACEFQDNPIRSISDTLTPFLGNGLKWRMKATDIGKRQETLKGR